MKPCREVQRSAARRWAALAVCAALLAGGDANAFNSVNWSFWEGMLNPHKTASQPGLEARGFECDALTTVLNANYATDSAAGPGTLLTWHFCREPIGALASDAELSAASNLAFHSSVGVIQQCVGDVETYAEADPAYALTRLGRALHVLQDFYAHSNWYALPSLERGQATVEICWGSPVYAGTSLRLTAWGAQSLLTLCEDDGYPHGAKCPLMFAAPGSCAQNNDCWSALYFSESESYATDATGQLLSVVINRINTHRYTQPNAEVLRKLLEFGCDEPQISSPEEEELPGAAVESADPNEIIGPPGGGVRRATPVEGAWRYDVYFENLAKAGASANDVFVTNPIDLRVLDPGTLIVESVGMSGRTVMLSRPVTEIDTVIDLRPARSCLVRLTGTMSSAGDTLRWTFHSLDPATGEAPTEDDPDAGFLPPNRNGPEGEGVVSYSIRPVAGLADGTIVSNQASVVFDIAPPIDTGTWSNLVDATPPTLSELQAEVLTDSTVKLRWTGVDGASGVRTCDVFAVPPAGAPRLVAIGVTTDTLVLHARAADGTAAFIAILEDSAGNRRPMPSQPDATVSWSLIDDGTGLSGVRVFPQPAREAFTLSFRLSSAADVACSLYDVAGRRVWTRGAAKLQPGLHALALSPDRNLRSGVYWLRVTAGTQRLHSRVVILR